MRNEVPLLGLQGCPVLQVLGKSPLLSCSEGSSAFLPICPCHGIPWKGDKGGGFSQQWFILHAPGRDLSFQLGRLLEEPLGGLAGQHPGATEAGGMLSLSARLAEPLQGRELQLLRSWRGAWWWLWLWRRLPDV